MKYRHDGRKLENLKMNVALEDGNVENWPLIKNRFLSGLIATYTT